MSIVVEKALDLWGMQGASHRLIAARENAVYQVMSDRGPVALRLHRQGYRTDAELRSELAWMAVAADGGIDVPAPISAQNGDLLCHVDGVQVDVLAWLSGVTLTDVVDNVEPRQRAALFRSLGHEMARLHQVSDEWTPPPQFQRVHWNHDGLLGPAPLWDCFWQNPKLTEDDRALFLRFRDAASVRLSELEPSLEYGLIHADLVPANVLVDGDDLKLIDFDDGGYGYRLFDVATVLLKYTDRPDFSLLRDELLAGYWSVRSMDVTELDLFLALRAATYVGWNISRMEEAGGAERNQRFVDKLRDFATHWMQS